MDHRKVTNKQVTQFESHTIMKKQCNKPDVLPGCPKRLGLEVADPPNKELEVPKVEAPANEEGAKEKPDGVDDGAAGAGVGAAGVDEGAAGVDVGAAEVAEGAARVDDDAAGVELLPTTVAVPPDEKLVPAVDAGVVVTVETLVAAVFVTSATLVAAVGVTKNPLDDVEALPKTPEDAVELVGVPNEKLVPPCGFTVDPPNDNENELLAVTEVLVVDWVVVATAADDGRFCPEPLEDGTPT